MPQDSYIKLEGVEAYIKKIGVEGVTKAAKKGLGSGAEYAMGQIVQSRPTPSRKPQAQLWTDKQRRGFFAKLRSGEIGVPYRRGVSPNSEDSLHKWSVHLPNWFTARIGNSASYIGLIRGKPVAPYHRGNWEPAEDVVKSNMGTIVRKITDDIQAWLKK